MKILELNSTQKTIFTSLLALNVIDFITAENVDTLNVGYYEEHAQLFTLSMYYEKLITLENEGEIESANTEIAKYIAIRFKDKWNKIYSVLQEDYNPLENYNMNQTETPNITRSRETDLNVNISSESNNYVSGFNSTIPQHATKGTTSGDTRTTGVKENNLEIESGTRGLTRSGNIGVTTSQQMLESELKLREYDFYKVVYQDLDKILCSYSLNL